MPYSNIEKPSKYFEPVLYTGNNANNRTINTTENFQADLFWIKARSTGASHILNDILRSSGYLLSNATSAEGAYSSLSWTNTAPASTGFTIDYGSNGSINGTGTTFVSWCWKANGTGVSNTAGSITSTVSANTTSGFSIVSYTATSGASSIGHGLGVAPKMIILKARGQSSGWVTGFSVLGWNKYLEISDTDAVITDRRMFSPTAGTDPTSTLFWSDQSAIGSAGTMIAYCFAEVKGYSKFGSYTGNGSTDGTFVYTGFKPAFVMTKSSSTGGTYYDWGMMDNKRANPFNVIDAQVCANLSDQENSANIGSQKIDFLSNGFKPRVTGSSHNGSGVTYIYMAFAENPFCSSKGIACTAR